MKKKYIWYKQTVAPDLKIIECPVYDPIKDFRRDPAGVYLLIRCDAGKKSIEAAVCDRKHTITHIFRGRRAQDIYVAILEYEKKNRLRWFSRKEHAAYLGKELKKCEYAILGKEAYVQE